jgi:hypothetical protein
MKIVLISFILLCIALVAILANRSLKAKNSKSTGELKLTAVPQGVKKIKNIGSIKIKDMDGNELSLSSFKGKVLLIVNVASECGFTPQYKRLQELNEKYKKKGVSVILLTRGSEG